MCKQTVFEFQEHNRRKVTASFDGGQLSSDASGSLLLRELERRTGLIASLAGCFNDHRDPRRIEHSLEELLRQRIGALTLGYEDLNDHDHLRYDPALALMRGKDDVQGLDRNRKGDRGKALAAHSTLNRFELGALQGNFICPASSRQLGKQSLDSSDIVLEFRANTILDTPVT